MVDWLSHNVLFQFDIIINVISSETRSCEQCESNIIIYFSCKSLSQIIFMSIIIYFIVSCRIVFIFF